MTLQLNSRLKNCRTEEQTEVYRTGKNDCVVEDNLIAVME